jgi:hypothetical protein
MTIYREWRHNPHILNLNTIGRWVFSFMHWLFYPWGKSTQYALDRRLGRTHNQSGHDGEEKKSLPEIISCSSSLSSHHHTD